MNDLGPFLMILAGLVALISGLVGLITTYLI